MAEKYNNIETKSLNESELWSMVLSLEALERRGFPIVEIVGLAVEQLRKIYSISADKNQLQIAVLELKAYLVMGRRYQLYEELFDWLLREMKIDKENFLICYGAKKIKLNRSQVRSLIPRWMPTKSNPLKVSEVVEDIIRKIAGKEKGRYTYEYCKKIGREYECYLYELIVTEGDSYFHNVYKMEYYVFEREREQNDTDRSIG